VPTLGPDVGHPATGGAHGIQTRFGENTFVVVRKVGQPRPPQGHGAGPHMAADASRIKDLIASRVIHVLSAA